MAMAKGLKAPRKPARSGPKDPTAWVNEKSRREAELAAIVVASGDVRTASHVRPILDGDRQDRDAHPATNTTRETPMPTEPRSDTWRLDTPAKDAVRAVSALVPADLAAAFLSVRMDGSGVRVSLVPTGDPLHANLSVAVPADGAKEKAMRLLVLRFLHDAAAVASGEAFAV